VGSKVLGYGHQLRCETFGTDVVHTFPDRPPGIVHPVVAGFVALPAPGPALDLSATHVANQGRAMGSGSLFQVIQQLAALFALPFELLPFHDLQQAIPLVNRHFPLARDGSFGDMIICWNHVGLAAFSVEEHGDLTSCAVGSIIQ
jgi:hypothetical protein